MHYTVLILSVVIMISFISMKGYKNTLEAKYFRTPDNKLKRYINYDNMLDIDIDTPIKVKFTNKYSEDTLNDVRKFINFDDEL